MRWVEIPGSRRERDGAGRALRSPEITMICLGCAGYTRLYVPQRHPAEEYGCQACGRAGSERAGGFQGMLYGNPVLTAGFPTPPLREEMVQRMIVCLCSGCRGSITYREE